jgi:hypothetical protein
MAIGNIDIILNIEGAGVIIQVFSKFKCLSKFFTN